MAEEAGILLKTLSDTIYSLHHTIGDTFDFELKRSMKYCVSIDRSTLWGEVKYGAYTLT